MSVLGLGEVSVLGSGDVGGVTKFSVSSSEGGDGGGGEGVWRSVAVGTATGGTD